jgi:hypothetical protein
MQLKITRAALASVRRVECAKTDRLELLWTATAAKSPGSGYRKPRPTASLALPRTFPTASPLRFKF